MDADIFKGYDVPKLADKVDKNKKGMRARGVKGRLRAMSPKHKRLLVQTWEALLAERVAGRG
jgi:hypothetical protein